MKKYEHIQIGTFHTNHCEDYLVSSEIGTDKLMIAVLDGCSMGNESHFASSLIGKILLKGAKEIHFKDFFEKEKKHGKFILKNLMELLFKDLISLKNNLQLEKEGLLSTLVLGIIDLKKKNAEIICVGDGIVSCNGKLYEFEQNNKPDYLAYHLHENFSEWFEKQNQKLSFSDIYDLGISTDGIFTFRKFDDKNYEQNEKIDLVNYLLIDENKNKNEYMLRKKTNHIETKWGLKPSDDLAIIRIII